MAFLPSHQLFLAGVGGEKGNADGAEGSVVASPLEAALARRDSGGVRALKWTPALPRAADRGLEA